MEASPTKHRRLHLPRQQSPPVRLHFIIQLSLSSLNQAFAETIEPHESEAYSVALPFKTHLAAFKQNPFRRNFAYWIPLQRQYYHYASEEDEMSPPRTERRNPRDRLKESRSRQVQDYDFGETMVVPAQLQVMNDLKMLKQSYVAQKSRRGKKLNDDAAILNELLKDVFFQVQQLAEMKSWILSIKISPIQSRYKREAFQKMVEFVGGRKEGSRREAFQTDRVRRVNTFEADEEDQSPSYQESSSPRQNRVPTLSNLASKDNIPELLQTQRDTQPPRPPSSQ